MPMTPLVLYSMIMRVLGESSSPSSHRIAFQVPNMRHLVLMENESMPPCLMSRAILWVCKISGWKLLNNRLGKLYGKYSVPTKDLTN